MAYVSADYKNNAKAPKNKFVGVSGSFFFSGSLSDWKAGTSYGECVTYVKAVTPDLALKQTKSWKKGDQVKGNSSIVEGTVVATFTGGGYTGHENHAGIYEKQDASGIYVWDQYWDHKHKTPTNAKAVGQRLIRFGGPNPVNDGNAYFVVELK